MSDPQPPFRSTRRYLTGTAKYNLRKTVKKQLHVLFSGMVQGVGFRFTAERLARSYPVSGYVRNLPNGEVEILAEGEEKSLEEFLKAIEEAFPSSIRKIDTTWSEATGEYHGFSIKF